MVVKTCVYSSEITMANVGDIFTKPNRYTIIASPEPIPFSVKGKSMERLIREATARMYIKLISTDNDSQIA